MIFPWNKLAVFLIVIPVLVLLTWFVRSTRQGKAMRAVAQDTEASAMMGINVNRTISVTFFIAGALAAAAGLVYLLQFNMRYDTGFQLGPDRVHRGGARRHREPHRGRAGRDGDRLRRRRSTKGSTARPGSDWTRSIVFGILIVMLVFRPQGILGERTPEGA